MRIRLWMGLCLFLASAGLGNGAEMPADATAAVPELESFHKVISRIWHEAWPQKDTALLERLLPDVEKGVADVGAASLPGILRHKREAWDRGIRDLESARARYKAAAAAGDGSGLLAAAEALHAAFESLVRTVRPALKELDEFHAILYLLYHHHLPAQETDRIRSAAAELAVKMGALNAARLPERLMDRDPEFQAGRGALSGAVDELAAAAAANGSGEVKGAVESVHSRYQALARVFE